MHKIILRKNQGIWKKILIHFFEKLFLKVICLYSNIIYFGKVEDLEDEDDVLVPPDTFKDANGTTLTEVTFIRLTIISMRMVMEFQSEAAETQ